MSDSAFQVEALIRNAGKETDSLRAQQFAQAALNAANAFRCLLDAKCTEKE